MGGRRNSEKQALALKHRPPPSQFGREHPTHGIIQTVRALSILLHTRRGPFCQRVQPPISAEQLKSSRHTGALVSTCLWPDTHAIYNRASLHFKSPTSH